MGVANQTPADVANDYATLSFIINQLTAGNATATIVKVIKCTNDGGLSAVGSVDVQLLVNTLDADGSPILPNASLFNLPYTRIQGGTNAVIIDPQPGDIGIAVFASRDISAVKKSKAQANPGSARKFNLADGMYIGGLLNGVPVQYVQFNAEGVKVVSPTTITLQAPTITLDGDVVGTAGGVFADDVIAAGISTSTHTHGGVQSGGSNTAIPNP